MSPTSTQRLSRLALLTSAVIGITACGGGGGGGSEPAPTFTPTPPAPTSVTGTVLVSPPAPAEVFQPAPPPPPPASNVITVCFDSNANGSCDTGEPSTIAAVDGSYSLIGLPGSQAADAQVLAVVSLGSSTPYMLRAPVSRATLISPTTTLVQAGVTQGLSLAQAEVAVARQLQVGTTDLYRHYLNSPATASEDSVMLLNDWAIIASLRDGVPLAVGGGAAAGGDLVLSRLNIASAVTWDARFYQNGNYDAATATTELYTLPEVRTNGLATPPSSLNASLMSHGRAGWVPIPNEAAVNHLSAGNPYAVHWGNGTRNAVSEREIDVSGLAIHNVIQEVQNATLYSQPSITGTLPTILTGTMPAGARVKQVRWKARYVENYNPAASILGANSLATLVTAYAISATPGGDNTLSLGTAPGAPSCNGSMPVCTGLNLRVAFDAATQGLTYYRCDSDFALVNATNCVPMATGTYTLGMSNDGTSPLMRLVNSPGNTVTGFVERGAQVFTINRPSGLGYAAGSTLRLNRIAYNAFAAAAGLPAAPSLATRSPHMGMWRATYSGGESGTCAWVLIDARGRLAGECRSTAARSFALMGTVADQGNFSSSGANDVFGGIFLATTASGVWSQPTSGASGNWSAVKY